MNIKKLNSPVSDNLRRIIAESGLKQVSVAKRIGCTPQELTDMIYGRRIIKVNDVPRISAALGVDISALFVPVQNREAV